MQSAGLLENYEEAVYAGVLGKVIGVYLGRPIEGWLKADVLDQFGAVDRYLADERGLPLIVADDDITGTFTFVRALEDCGKYAETSAEDFGKMWLNYIIERQTILWWGGRGVSTEHTAFLRLKEGIKPPLSGSCALNGKIVSEQIGAQIFIDALGLVAPGNPQLAAELARRSASVSHDGEAVNGAVVVAAMVSLAFVEKDLERLLDRAIGFIPKGSTIAKVHEDVRAWAKEDADWLRTFARIEEKYGYDKFGGCCHMVPNHAVMVMAWAYAQGSFLRAQTIVNSAGWDTDCNAANVGSVMGVLVGLSGINAEYDFQGPMADRLLLPTAEPSFLVTDCLLEAERVAEVGRKVMGWPKAERAKAGAWLHFSFPGALHGFQSEPNPQKTRPTATLTNVAWGKSRAMAIDFKELGARSVARVSTPVYTEPVPPGMSYGVMGSPTLYPGQRVKLSGHLELARGPAEVALYLRYFEPETKAATRIHSGEAQAFSKGGEVEVTLEVPDLGGWPPLDLGVQISGAEGRSGRLVVDTVSVSGRPHFALQGALPKSQKGLALGFVVDTEGFRSGFSEEPKEVVNIIQSVGRGHLVTGNRSWADYTVSAFVRRHLASASGLLARWQGRERYVAAYGDGEKLRLVLRYHGEERLLAEAELTWPIDEQHHLELSVSGSAVTVKLDGELRLAGEVADLDRGGFGLLTCDGVTGFWELRAEHA